MKREWQTYLCGTLATYFVMVCVSFFIFAQDAKWCSKASWDNLSVSGFDIMFMAGYSAVLWPLSIPSTLFVYEDQQGHMCFVGGK